MLVFLRFSTLCILRRNAKVQAIARLWERHVVVYVLVFPLGNCDLQIYVLTYKVNWADTQFDQLYVIVVIV